MHWTQATSTWLAAWLAQPRQGLITDMDGTISPIVDQPGAARVTPRNRELLAALSERLTLVAVVSGRAAADVRDRVGLPNVVYIGNHGMEIWRDGAVHTAPEAAPFQPAVAQVTAAMDAYQQPGVFLEDKGTTLSIHYRRTANPAAFAATLREPLNALAASLNLTVFEGRMVFEVRPPIAINKGTALTGLIRDYALDAVCFSGDDTTDVDALRAVRAARESGLAGVGVGVESVNGETPPTLVENADIMAHSVQDVENFFGWLLAAL